MKNGYNGKILRVDLSNGDIWADEPEEDFYRTYLGGWGLIGYYLLKELEPGIDPLGPENKLIFALGPLAGAPLAGGRNAVGAKSPLTDTVGEADVGGFWGPELKLAGYDGIIVEGRAERPVYLWIHDGEVEIRDAIRLWGKLTGESQEMIHQELGDRHVRTAQIGPAGEKMVRYACVMNGLNHAAGRSGLGAVMGSKNLKAIAVRGHARFHMADPETIRNQSRWLLDHYKEYVLRLVEIGTGKGMPDSSAAGGLPTRNFREGVFEGVEKIAAETVRDTIRIRMEGCYACPVRCKKVVQVEEPYKVDPIYGGPEYETLASLGSCCGVDDLKALSKGNEICNAYSMDTISAGVSVAFVMECYENGLITKEDTGGLELNFGNAEAMVQLLEMVGKRQGFGDFVAEGVKRMSQRIGKGSEVFAMHVKGQEVPMHDPRARSMAMAVGQAVSPTGADHVHINTWRFFANSVGLCVYMPYDEEQVKDIVNAITGWDTSIDELTDMADRSITLARVFNIREGFTVEDDWLPLRLLTPFESGPKKGVRIDPEELKKARRIYYETMGWDPQTGIPTRAKLEELGMGWVADELARYDMLPCLREIST